MHGLPRATRSPWPPLQDDGAVVYSWIRRADFLPLVLSAAGLAGAGEGKDAGKPQPRTERASGAAAATAPGPAPILHAGRPLAPARSLGPAAAPTLPPVTSRDLRAIDVANFAADSRLPAILVRHRAVVINMAAVRALITPSTAYFVLEDGADEQLEPLLRRLHALQPMLAATRAAVAHGAQAGGRSSTGGRREGGGEGEGGEDDRHDGDGTGGDASGALSPTTAAQLESDFGADSVPFELYVLETVLTAACEDVQRRYAAAARAVDALVAILGTAKAQHAKHVQQAR
jgi:hypothetical protein